MYFDNTIFLTESSISIRDKIERFVPPENSLSCKCLPSSNASLSIKYLMPNNNPG